MHIDFIKKLDMVITYSLLFHSSICVVYLNQYIVLISVF